MALHHFHWNGKERSVSISRHENNSVVLRFADEELNEHGVDKIIVSKKVIEQEPSGSHSASNGTIEQEILQSVKASVNLSSYFK
jgi:hypothetical protein